MKNMAKEPKKSAQASAEALEQAEKAAEVSGTGDPVHHPEDSKMPEPGLTEDTADILNTDEAKALSPNITISGTKPDGQGGQQLLDTVDPAVANAGVLPPRVHKPAENPSLAPEDEGRQPVEGEVVFECTADNQPFYAGGPMKQGQKYVMTKEEGDLLTQTKAGRIVGSTDNAKVEGDDAT